MINFKEKLKNKIDLKLEDISHLLHNYGNVTIDFIKIAQVIGGMRNLKALTTDISYIDPYNGIHYRNYNLKNVLEKLPKARNSNMPYVEGQFYLLMTGDIPTENEVNEIINLFQKHRKIPDYVYRVLNSLPIQTKPEVMFSIAIDAMQQESVFARAYIENKVTKQNAWEFMLEDVLSLIPKIPIISAYIYRLKYKNNKYIPEDPNLDFAANFAHMLGINKPYDDFLRLYFILLSDHENGNVTAHTTHLVASAWADAYHSWAAGINALAGPLHGGAIKESFRWLKKLYGKISDIENKILTEQEIKRFSYSTLKSGQIIPGYGHAVLRNRDPRFEAQLEFGKRYLLNDDLFKLACFAYEIIPNILRQYTKAQNPWPNVDNISGIIHAHYGVDEDFFPVIFGNALCIGVLSNLVWDKALRFPIERPRSITTEQMLEFVKNLDHN